MMKKVSIIIFFLFLCSCNGSKYREPDFYFKGEFNPALVNSLETYLKNLAEDKGYRVFEKKRSHMKVLTGGKEAFYISFYENKGGKLILFITNGGGGTKLTLALFSSKRFSLQESKDLSVFINHYLRTEMDIDMKPVNPNGGVVAS